MTKNQYALVGYKIFFGLLGFSAIVTEIAILVDRGVFNPVNFFSYFTVENNILMAITFLVSALAVAAGKKSRALDVLRGVSTVMILVVGIGFVALLSTMDPIVLTAVPWDNLVLHYIIPIAALIDYLIDRPATKFDFRRSLAWLLLPIIYVSYALTRGALTGWYPYPFLDPATSGYGSVAFVISSLLVLGIALVWGAAKFSGKPGAK